MAAKATSHWPITLTNGVAALFSVALPLVLVRILSPDQVGRYNIFFLYAMLTPGLFMTAGLTNGLYHWAGKYPEAKPEVRQSWTLLMGIALTICALGLIALHWAAPFINFPKLDLQLILLSAPFIIGAAFFEDLMIARGDIWKGSWYSSGFNVFRIASLLAAAWWTRRLTAVYWAFFAGIVLRALTGWLLLAKSGDIHFLFSSRKTKNVLNYAFPVSIAAAAGLALHYVDQMVLSFRLNPAQFAFYAVGCLSIPPLEILSNSVNRVLIPRLSQAFAAGETPEAAGLFSESVAELFRILLPATVGLIIYSQPIIQILFTSRYQAAAHYLQFYALVYLFTALPYDAVARARGDGGWILRTSLFFAGFSLGATWLAASRWGAMGALIAVLAWQFLIRVYSLSYEKRWLSASFSEFLPLRDMALQCGLAALATAGSIMLRPFFSDPRVWFGITGPLFTVIYFGGTYAIYLRRLSTAPGPVHVLELSQTLGLGGLERTIYTLAQTLNQNQRFKVLVATYDHTEGQPSLVAQFEESGIRVIRWQKGNGFSFRSVFRLVHLVFTERTRILHAHNLGPLVYGSLAKVLSFGRVRLILTVHSWLDVQPNRRDRLYYKFFLRFPDRIIAVSPAVKAGLQTLGIKAKRIEVIPNGVPFPFSQICLSEPAEKLALRKRVTPRLLPELYAARWILCMARLHSGKGQDIVLDVWSALPKDIRAGLALFFVGQETHTGYQDALRERIGRLPDPERVILAGPAERPQEWLQSADVFISGSLHEGMPLAPLEAAGSGLPTLLSEIEGHRFLQPWAYYFDPQKPLDGAARILEILDTLKNDGEKTFYENRWNAAAPVRQQWGAPAMTDSYAETFETA